MISILPVLSLKDYQEDRHERGIFDKRNPLNDLTGKEWLFSTKTVIPKIFPLIWPENTKSRNYNPVPSDLSKEIVETFSKPGDTILDPFAGIGSTLIGSYFANEYHPPPRRIYIGIESNKSLVDKYTRLTRKLDIPDQGMLIDDPLTALSEIKDDSVDFVLSDIPIWDISGSNNYDNVAMSLERYNQSPIRTLQHWCSSISTILSETINKLKESKYLVLSIPNGSVKTRSNNMLHPQVNLACSAILAHSLQKIGLVLKAERIWFETNPKDGKDIYRPLRRRFLVFRKEISSSTHTDLRSIYFEDKIPIGNTFIIHKAFPPSFNHKLRSEHGGMKPPELAQLLIELYSKGREGVILDPFAGVGGTLLGASIAERKAIGIDINERWKTIYQQVSKESGFPLQEFLVGDSRSLVSNAIKDNSIDLILTDVPYWAMDKLEKTRGRFSKAGEQSQDKLHSSLHQFDQASILTIEEWLDVLETVFTACYSKLIPDKYLVVFIGNMYRTIEETKGGKTRKVGKYLFLSSMLAKVLLKIGYRFQTETIWYAPDKALHVFGYPFSYIPSVVHQNILVFKK